ncbi:nucleotidyltransferase family protein [Limnothrix sp. FACHB-881]|uniref:nucleotidyltransferase family protein n=1 Tax=Limnothrix sp. FACHB-881 TaxID=2692819 RepID=UPI0016820D1E|nr:nucleotidyltransferase family protein [Limnothrix sp. FACHB-881]MBD2635497.1 nucleotidyltransferase family protein [Limnothrix sp. FACHB-881]
MTNLTAETVLETLRQQPNLFEQYNIKTLALFGSTARNQATEHSDLDFLVEFAGDPTLNLYMSLKFFLEDLFQKKIDLVIQEDIKPQIKESIIKKAIYVTQPQTVSSGYSQ